MSMPIKPMRTYSENLNKFEEKEYCHGGSGYYLPPESVPSSPDDTIYAACFSALPGSQINVSANIRNELGVSESPSTLGPYLVFRTIGATQSTSSAGAEVDIRQATGEDQFYCLQGTTTVENLSTSTEISYARISAKSPKRGSQISGLRSPPTAMNSVLDSDNKPREWPSLIGNSDAGSLTTQAVARLSQPDLCLFINLLWSTTLCDIDLDLDVLAEKLYTATFIKNSMELIMITRPGYKTRQREHLAINIVLAHDVSITRGRPHMIPLLPPRCFFSELIWINKETVLGDHLLRLPFSVR
ncbi:hypothetical protein F4604DRAFT_1903015 [Suillus subluteus]|nr:hypothetical protein F4604DRAFT_1903015 [Suillus subluteus]